MLVNAPPVLTLPLLSSAAMSQAVSDREEVGLPDRDGSDSPPPSADDGTERNDASQSGSDTPKVPAPSAMVGSPQDSDGPDGRDITDPPPAFAAGGSVRGLRHVDLSGSGLAALQDSIGALTGLRRLEVR